MLNIVPFLLGKGIAVEGKIVFTNYQAHISNFSFQFGLNFAGLFLGLSRFYFLLNLSFLCNSL